MASLSSPSSWGVNCPLGNFPVPPRPSSWARCRISFFSCSASSRSLEWCMMCSSASGWGGVVVHPAPGPTIDPRPVVSRDLGIGNFLLALRGRTQVVHLSREGVGGHLVLPGGPDRQPAACQREAIPGRARQVGSVEEGREHMALQAWPEPAEHDVTSPRVFWGGGARNAL